MNARERHHQINEQLKIFKLNYQVGQFDYNKKQEDYRKKHKI